MYPNCTKNKNGKLRLLYEAKTLIDLGGVVPVSTTEDCTKQLLELMQNDELRDEKGSINSKFVTQNQGATEKPFTTAKTLFAFGCLKPEQTAIGLWMPPQEWTKQPEQRIMRSILYSF